MSFPTLIHLLSYSAKLVDIRQSQAFGGLDQEVNIEHI